MILMLGGCAESTESTESNNSSDSRWPLPTPSIATEIIPDKIYYLPGENVAVEVVFDIVGFSTATIKPYPPSISIVSLNECQLIRSFTEGIGELSLAPDEKKSYEFTWNQEGDSGHKVPSGMSYNIRVQFTKGLPSKPESAYESTTYHESLLNILKEPWKRPSKPT
jgi:hypothetical protein